ncbi:hypothetical protein IWX48DRAFT_404520 [Phyllosticta citricarpa]
MAFRRRRRILFANLPSLPASSRSSSTRSGFVRAVLLLPLLLGWSRSHPLCTVLLAVLLAVYPPPCSPSAVSRSHDLHPLCDCCCSHHYSVEHPYSPLVAC